MVALAALVVIADYPHAIHYIHQTIFVVMLAGYHWIRNSPDRNLDNACSVLALDSLYLGCIHGAYNAPYYGARQTLYSSGGGPNIRAKRNKTNCNLILLHQRHTSSIPLHFQPFQKTHAKQHERHAAFLHQTINLIERDVAQLYRV